MQDPAGSFKAKTDEYWDKHDGLMTGDWFNKHIAKTKVPAPKVHPGLEQSFGPFGHKADRPLVPGGALDEAGMAARRKRVAQHGVHSKLGQHGSISHGFTKSATGEFLFNKNVQDPLPGGSLRLSLTRARSTPTLLPKLEGGARMPSVASSRASSAAASLKQSYTSPQTFVVAPLSGLGRMAQRGHGEYTYEDLSNAPMTSNQRYGRFGASFA
jgi:hypothetical protein